MCQLLSDRLGWLGSRAKIDAPVFVGLVRDWHDNVAAWTTLTHGLYGCSGHLICFVCVNDILVAFSVYGADLVYNDFTHVRI